MTKPISQSSNIRVLFFWMLQFALLAMPIALQGHNHTHFGKTSNSDEHCVICQLDQTNQAGEPESGELSAPTIHDSSTPIPLVTHNDTSPDYSFALPRSPPLCSSFVS
ncbi:MAG: hypothetical protein OEM52_03410 [bacterium]|nr:hypothetical protein [bacterium]